MAVRKRSLDRSIVEGPVGRAVWRLAWPTMLQNVIGGLQGIVDHAMVGHTVGFTGNAAVGVAGQIFIVVIVFIASIFTGMGILVARFAGADEPDKVDRAVYQAFLVALALAVGVMAPLGYFLSPVLLDLVNAEPSVQAEALPYLRIMFLFSFGMMMFFMLSGALRSAGDAKTPLRLGIALTVLNLALNLVFIPVWGTAGAAIGTVLAGSAVGLYSLYRLISGKWVVHFTRGMGLRPDWKIIRELFRFGLPTGFQGIAMNVGGVLLLGFIGSLANSAEAQAAYSVAYAQLFSLITWTSVGLMGAAATVAGQNLGVDRPERSVRAVRTAAIMGLGVATMAGALFVLLPDHLLSLFNMEDETVVAIGRELLAFLCVSGFFVTLALTYTGGLQGTGDTRGPLYISLISQVAVPLLICSVASGTLGLEARHVWFAIVVGHMVRGLLSMLRFDRGRWRDIEIRV
ncbi:MAG: MATE family efflux transporter [Gemmatimonadetes bacterium]|nr:MATE family efflux transporter [Gemmatimonadota bacterium]